jgi:hypothetical protein
MRPSVVLDMKRNAVREVVGRFRTANPRVFGSVLHGTTAMAATSICWSMRCLVQHCLIWAACKTSWNRCSASTSIC